MAFYVIASCETVLVLQSKHVLPTQRLELQLSKICKTQIQLMQH